MSSILVTQKEVSHEERTQITQQVNAELVEHLYRGCLPGTIAGIPVGIAFFIDFYGHTPTGWLIAWSIYYLFALANLTAVYFVYVKNKPKLTTSQWLWIYSIAMCMCAIAWGLSSILIPTDSIFRQYVAIIALLIFANGYAAGSIGVFELCVATLTIIMAPLATWCFLAASSMYKLMGVFVVVYFFFLLGVNRRSTQWFKDSLKLKLENTLVSYQANHDLLTDLPNQRMLPQFFDAAIAHIKDTPNTFALVCFSLNRMEMINDSLGHQAGDKIIQSVANRLTELSNKMATSKISNTEYIITISRKDTFTILIIPTTLEDLESQAKLLFTVLDQPIYLEQQGITITASAGVSMYEKDGSNLNTLMIGADAAMLEAKQAGGNRLEFYRAEIIDYLPKQLEIENDLHDALKKNQFEVHYQPIIDIRTNKISGMEALLRWVHPIHGFISPAKFIPIAEETGLIVPIGEWIMREACKQTVLWHQMGFDELKVAVNLSEKQLRQKNIIETILQVLADTKLDKKYLEMELTETAILDDTINSVIKEFKNIGLSLSVDDFGTGYSGLSYLKRFSVDKLKVDQSFIRDIPENSDSVAIVSAILAMGHELKIKTLAEGVETLEQLQFLKAKGCNYVQGYYFSKPLEAKLFTKFLEGFEKETSQA